MAGLAIGLTAGDPGEAAVLAVATLVPAGLGVRIDRALPAHGIGLRLALLALAVGLMGVADQLAVASGDPDALLTRWALLIGDVAFFPLLYALAAVVLAFPSGRPPTASWARRERAMTAVVAVGTVSFLFDGSDLTLDGAPVTSPLPVVVVFTVLAGVFVAAMLAWLVAVAVNVRRRYRAGTGIERLQLRWLAFAGATVPAIVAICLLEAAVAGENGVAAGIALVTSLVALPSAIAVAVLRYRLYEIDRLINRTLVYVSLTAVLGAAYAAIVLVVGVVLGGGTAWATAGATLVVATAFRPVRDRAQRLVDRRFARRRFEGLRRIEEFLEQVRSGREEPERIGAVLANALGDDGLEVFFRLPATDGYADATGRVRPLPDDRVRARTPVRRSELELAVVLHDPALAETPDTLDSVLRATGLAMEIARLRVEVRVQLAAVEASRARLAAAAEAERRKLQRDLHDGAQQRLVALGLALRHAQHQLGAGDGGAGRTLDAAVGEIATSIAELRALAGGLGPPLLDEGLGPALADVAARAPVPVTVEVAPGELPEEAERTVFFAACEAITNAVKHAGAGTVRVAVSRTPNAVRLEVADDGRGGARPRPGGGLAGLAERVGARGGTLDVDSRDGQGTRVVAEVPLGT